MSTKNKNKKRKLKTAKRFTGKMQRKLVFCFGVVLIILVGLNARLLYINAASGDSYTKKVLEQKGYVSKTIPFRRGTIYDANGERLATSEKVYHVILDCSVINESDTDEQEETIRALASCFPDLTEDVVRGYLRDKPESAYIRALKEIPYDQVQPFIELQEAEDSKIVGVWFEETYVRRYPNNYLASHLIGFTESGTNGFWGVEEYYNDVLNGTEGRTYGYLNDDSNVETTTQAAVDGNNVVMTIDAGIQRIVEEKVTAFNEQYRNGAQPGLGSSTTAVIVMNPNTGDILAECVYPYFDLNNPTDLTYLGQYTQADVDAMKAVDEEHAQILKENPDATFDDDERKGYLEALNERWRNFCISDTYEPGSTFKPFTVAAGLESGTLTGNEQYYCDGYEIVDGVRVKCSHTSGHGLLTVEESVADSCNDALMQMSYAIGVNHFTKFQEIFGFGKKTGIDLPGEVNAAGLLYTADSMTALDLAVNAFGQNFNATMTQMMAGFCSLINGGQYYQPRVVKQITNTDNEVLKTFEPKLLKETVSSETSEKIRQYLYATVEKGTSVSAKVSGYTIGGKTGTAEKFPRGQGNYLVSFISFAPVENPELAFYVVIDEPNTQDQANSKLAVVLAQQIMAEVLPYYGVETETVQTDSEAQTSEADESWTESFIEDPDTNHFEDNEDYISGENDYYVDGDTDTGESGSENYPDDSYNPERDGDSYSEDSSEDSGGGE